MPNRHLMAKITAIVFALGCQSAIAADTIKFATEAAYPPFNMRAADGTIAGWEIDLGLAMCAKIGRKCEFVAQDWGGMIPGLLVRKFDAIFASMSITEERKKQINFTKKYYSAGLQFVGKAGMTLDTSDPSLGGKQVGTITGVTECYLAKKFPKAKVRVYDQADALYLDLSAGRVDVAYSESVAVDYGFLRTESGKNFVALTEPTFDECLGEGVGIGVRKEDDALREELNKAIDLVRADGTYDKIGKKYFDFDIYGPQ